MGYAGKQPTFTRRDEEVAIGAKFREAKMNDWASVATATEGRLSECSGHGE